MRYTLFAAVSLAVIVGLGCITDYGIITDNDQVANGQGSGIVDTNGKAHIREVFQGATIWPDGTDELLSFVDQKADGTATLTTYNNYSTGGDPTFHDDLYCNSAWTGCSIFTAPDDNDENLFDGVLNASCKGARSLSILLSTDRYYGECGSREAKLRVDQKIALMGSAASATMFGRQGLLWHLDGGNTSVRVRNLSTGVTVALPWYGATADLFMGQPHEPTVLRMDHPMLGMAMRDYATRLDNELHAEALELTIEHNGVPISFTVSGGDHPSINSATWRRIANVRF